jgi:large subunit ribosomal protein L21
MYAIVDINGKQFKVEEGKFIDVDLMDQEEGAAITLDQVLMVSDGSTSTIGKPLVSGASVTAKVMTSYQDKKVIVYKMRPKKGYRRKYGHRQQYTRVMVEKINSAVAV